MKDEILKLYSEGGYEEILMEQVVTILSRPRIIRMPGAPANIAGLVRFGDHLIAVRYLEGAIPKDSFSCAVIVNRDKTRQWGILADNLTGGGQIDTVYGS